MAACPVVTETEECTLEAHARGPHRMERQDRDLAAAASEAARERRQQRADLALRALERAEWLVRHGGHDSDGHTPALLRELAAAVDPAAQEGV